MKNHTLILSTLVILLSIIILMMIIQSSSDQTKFDKNNSKKYGYFTNAQSTPIPFYNNKVLVFPSGTTDWKVVGDNSTYNSDRFYCLIDNEWHQCFPTEELR